MEYGVPLNLMATLGMFALFSGILKTLHFWRIEMSPLFFKGNWSFITVKLGDPSMSQLKAK